MSCDACARKPGEVNHPEGMIFVGWGHGWQPCPHCSVDPEEHRTRDETRRATIAECVALVEGYHEHALPGAARSVLESLLKDLEKMR